MASSSSTGMKFTDDETQKDCGKQEQRTKKNVCEPPDGGWGWVVVAASFLCNLILDGNAYSFGVFFTQLVEYYDAPKAKVAWIGSLLYGCYLIVGPLASVLTNRYGCRIIVIVGSVVSCIGFLLSTVAPNVDVLIVTYGIIGGIGFGFIYLPAVVIVGIYFSKKRALATGIAVSGSGVGAFVFAPLCQMLLEAYDWQKTLAILAGLNLSCIVFGALMIPLKPRSDRKFPAKILEQQVGTQQVDMRQGIKHSDPDNKKSEDILNLEKILGSDVYSCQPSKSTVDIDTSLLRFSRGKTCLCENNNDFIEGPTWKQEVRERHMSVVEHNEQSCSICCEDEYCRSIIGNIQRNRCLQTGLSRCTICKVSATEHGVPIDHPIACGRIEPESRGILSSPKISKKSTCSVSHFLDFSLLKNKAFLLFCIANFVGNIGILVPYVYIVDSSVLKGISSESGAFLLSLIGIANTVGRVLFGWLADRPSISGLLLNNITAALTGVCILCVPFCSSYVITATICCLFGFFLSASLSLTSVVLIELLSLDSLTDAFGLVSLFIGVSSILGPPFAGFVYDVTDGYDIPFYIAGVLLMLSSALSFLIPLVLKQPSETRTCVPTVEIDEGSQCAVAIDMTDMV